MPLLFNHPRQPPAGHHFTDPTGHIVRAKSLSALIVAVKEYRDNNALPAGNPEAEIEVFYAREYPWLVAKAEKGEVSPATPPIPKEERLRPWINRIWRDPPKHWQETEKAKARLEICKSCPYYTDFGALDPVYARRLLILAAGHSDFKALHCSINDWPCGLAVWMDTPADAKSAKVEGCWASA